jgi:hypothetical protein
MYVGQRIGSTHGNELKLQSQIDSTSAGSPVGSALIPALVGTRQSLYPA